MNISICIDAVYAGRDFYASLEEVRRLGVKYFEFWRWWDKDLARLKAAKDELGMELSAMCTKFISLVDAGKRREYLGGLRESVEAAGKLGCRKLISQVGNDLGTSRVEQRNSLIAGLKACVPLLEGEGITLLVEPLNTRVDHKGYFLTSSDEAFEVIGSVGSPNIKVLFDIYHQQIMEGDILRRITGNIDRIGHFHAAGNPGRHELNIGEINYQEIFRAIESLGYKGEVGFEYFPVNDPAEGIRAFL